MNNEMFWIQIRQSSNGKYNIFVIDLVESIRWKIDVESKNLTVICDAAIEIADTLVEYGGNISFITNKKATRTMLQKRIKRKLACKGAVQ